MVRDPVFSFNPDLADVNTEHRGRLLYFCDSTGTNEQGSTPARLITEDGFVLRMPHGTDNNPWLDLPMPASRFTEVLREEGGPDIVTDNTDTITSLIAAQRSGGCAIATADASTGSLAGLALLGLVIGGTLRRRRR
jgi:MYXO-CTERM domain-containing protein